MRATTHFWTAAGCSVAALLASAAAHAAAGLDPDWDVVPELGGSLVYDSNLNARRENLEDFYAAVTPKLTLARRNSATRFELNASVEQTWFQDFTEFDSTDPRAGLILEYPAGTRDELRTHLDVFWGRSSSTNADLGRRVRSEDVRGRWDQRVLESGRLAVDLRLAGSSVDYRDADLNTNDLIATEVRIGYAVTSRARVGVGYGHEWTWSMPPGAGTTIEGQEDRVLVRASGEFGPRLSGFLETGAAFVSYDGGVVRDDTAWIAAASLRWEAAVGSIATLGASRRTDFSPAGDTALRSDVRVDFSRELARGFAVRIGGAVERLETFFPGGSNHANAVSVVAALSYQLTERFSAEIADRYTRQRADRDELDYSRHLVTGRVAFRF